MKNLKKCNTCEVEKELSNDNFYVINRNKDNYNNKCIKCCLKKDKIIRLSRNLSVNLSKKEQVNNMLNYLEEKEQEKKDKRAENVINILNIFYRTELQHGELIIDNTSNFIANKLNLNISFVNFVLDRHLKEKENKLNYEIQFN